MAAARFSPATVSITVNGRGRRRAAARKSRRTDAGALAVHLGGRRGAGDGDGRRLDDGGDGQEHEGQAGGGQREDGREAEHEPEDEGDEAGHDEAAPDAGQPHERWRLTRRPPRARRRSRGGRR